MPHLSEFNPSVKDNIYSLAKTVMWDYDFIYSQAFSLLNRAIVSERLGVLKIDLSLLNKAHPSLVNNLIRIAIERVKGNLRRIESKHLEEILDLIETRPDASVVDIPLVKVIKDGKYLLFRRIAPS